MTATAPAPDAVSAAEQAALRTAVAELMARSCTEADVRRTADTAAGYDEKLWSLLTGELGVTGLLVPSSYGGADASFAEVALVCEELGRALCPSPYLATTLAALALVAGDDESLRAAHLPALAAGDLIGTVATAQRDVEHDLRVRDGRAQGSAGAVLDGQNAALFVLVADGGVFVAEPGAAGISVAPVPVADLTRRLARIELDGVPVTRIGGDDLATLLADAAAVALACEQVGGAQAALDEALSYAKVRTQFGRAIGSFQAVKHKCADAFLAIESGRAIAHRAAREIASQGPEVSTLASVAKAWCSDAYAAVAADNLQIHGGLGFTWEHSAHLHLRRAKTDELLFGDARHHRARLADLHGI